MPLSRSGSETKTGTAFPFGDQGPVPEREQGLDPRERIAHRASADRIVQELASLGHRAVRERADANLVERITCLFGVRTGHRDGREDQAEEPEEDEHDPDQGCPAV